MTGPATTKAPEDYGDVAAEYAALTGGAGLTDRSDTGRLRATGADALDLLNRLTTNNLEGLPDGTGVPSVLTSPKGRVVDLLMVGAQAGGLLLLTSPGREEVVAEWIDFYTFGEDAAFEITTPATAQFTLTGPEASQVLDAVLRTPLPRYHLAETAIAGVPVVVWHTLSAGAESYEVIVERAQAQAAWEALANAGAMPAGSRAWEAVRVAQGAPVYGAELGEETNPLESRLRGAVSFSKGCYTGQEVVARLDTYQKVQRRLMAVSLTGPAEQGDPLLADGQRAGTLTSVVQVPGADATVGLALVDARHARPGVILALPNGAAATLADPAYALATE